MKTIFAALALFAIASPAFADCATTSPVNVPVVAEAFNDIANGGSFDGTYGLAGTADCDRDIARAVDKAQDESAALAAALAQPTYLGDREQFAISGGLGFSEGEVAGGATVIGRLNRNVSAYAGGAVGSDNWAAKTGLRVGW